MSGKKRWWLSVTRAALLLSLDTASYAQPFTSFDPPGSNQTFAQSINSKGQIAGYYRTGTFIDHGFVREPDGAITVIECPIPGCSIQARAINSSGQIAGTFLFPGSLSNYRGFLRQPDGAFTAFVVLPGPLVFTWTSALNSKGQITGYAVDLKGAHGFVRQPDGIITLFDMPGALDTLGMAINSKGQIAGYYRDSKGHHGFLREPDGAITTFEAPNGTELFTRAMNSEGQIVGNYDDVDGTMHGCLWRPGRRAITVDAPNAPNTFPIAINSEGQIAGSAVTYFSFNARSHGFLRQRNGAFTSFEGPPGTLFTQPIAINSHGQIAGYYSDGAGQLHGFLRSRGSDDECDE